jgi:hypothetical protein
MNQVFAATRRASKNRLVFGWIRGFVRQVVDEYQVFVIVWEGGFGLCGSELRQSTALQQCCSVCFWFACMRGVLPVLLWVLAFTCFLGGLLALPLCGAASTFFCRKEIECINPFLDKGFMEQDTFLLQFYPRYKLSKTGTWNDGWGNACSPTG